MSEGTSSKLGRVVWYDLTVPNAEDVSAFYADVVGWERKPHDMGEYHDFDIRAGGETIAGVCHARGSNAGIPPQWLLYVTVEDVEASAARCTARGGRVIHGPRMMGKTHFCVIEDPAGAVLALVSDD